MREKDGRKDERRKREKSGREKESENDVKLKRKGKKRIR